MMVTDDYRMRWYRSTHSAFDVVKHDGEWHSEFALDGEDGRSKPFYVIYRTNQRLWWLLYVSNWVVSGPYNSAVEAKNTLHESKGAKSE